jgi:hypothetical protein
MQRARPLCASLAITTGACANPHLISSSAEHHLSIAATFHQHRLPRFRADKHRRRWHPRRHLFRHGRPLGKLLIGLKDWMNAHNAAKLIGDRISSLAR